LVAALLYLDSDGRRTQRPQRPQRIPSLLCDPGEEPVV